MGKYGEVKLIFLTLVAICFFYNLIILNNIYLFNLFFSFRSIPQSLIYTHDDVSRKVYDEVFTDDMLLAAPPPPVFDGVGEQHRFVTIRKNGKEPLVGE